MNLFRSALVCFVAAALAGCPSPTSPDVVVDGHGPDASDVAAVDAPRDVPPSDVCPAPSMSTLLGPCVGDSDCPAGASSPGICLTTYPGGFCTSTCGNDRDCTDTAANIVGVCRVVPGHTGKICVRECLNAADCGRSGYTCSFPTATANNGVCMPSCAPGDCQCGRCNAWTGLCDPFTAPNPPPGADDGQQCMSNADCRSNHCRLPVDGTTPNGHNGGYCESVCALGPGWNPTDLYSGDTFPQANCPTGAVCFPTNGTGVGEEGVCLAGCMADTDCRVGEGYFCERTFRLSRLQCASTVCVCPAGGPCGGHCRDFNTDAANCGACGAACGAGQVCNIGTCGDNCSAGLTNCDGSCVSLQTDANNCGTCGNACPAGIACTAGMCTCPPGQVSCNGTCANLSSDNANCGACGHACESAQHCSAGVCSAQCVSPTTSCSGVCTNTAQDVANCGSCGHACAAGGSCACSAHQVVAVPHTWNNGICQPIDCLNDTTHHCPTGYMCQTITTSSGGQTQMYGRCVPATNPDAGVTDGGTDAAADVGSDSATSDVGADVTLDVGAE